MFILLLLSFTFSEHDDVFTVNTESGDVEAETLGDAHTAADLPSPTEEEEEQLARIDNGRGRRGYDASERKVDNAEAEEQLARVEKGSCNTWRTYESCRINDNCIWAAGKDAVGRHCKKGGGLDNIGTFLSHNQRKWLGSAIGSAKGMGGGNVRAKMCYSKRRNGGSGNTFHKHCNGKGSTVVVVKLNTGKIMGGYTDSNWAIHGKYSHNDDSFLFSVSNKYVHKRYQHNYGIYGNNNYGPTWGGGHDFCIYNNWHGYCNLGHTYKCRTGHYGHANCRNDFCGRYSGWTVSKMEVYYFEWTGTGKLNIGSFLHGNQKSWLSQQLLSRRSNLRNKRAIRCYSKRHNGGDGRRFHDFCNGKGPTVTVARLNTGRIVGGYTSCTWAGGGYCKQPSFLFSVTHKFVHGVYQHNNGIYRHNGYGPTWGGGHDFCIHRNWHGYCNLGHNYRCRTGGYGSSQCRNDFCGRYSGWTVTDMEVYYFRNNGIEAELSAILGVEDESTIPTIIGILATTLILIAIFSNSHRAFCNKDTEQLRVPLL